MPYQPKKPCRVKTCPALAGKTGYCSKHEKERWEQIDSGRDPITKRLRNSRAWKILRANHLRANPVCVDCDSTTRLQVDHIVPHNGDPMLFFDQHNLITRCLNCHSKKTIKENINRND